MKKNKMMRIASVLLVAVLISTCAISGTFAKYVTKVSGTDKARVAKWGIVLTLSAGEVFDTEYITHDEAALEAGMEVSVKSSNEDKLVAPGTSAKDIDAEITGKVTGTPEVATRYALTFGAVKDVVLKAGKYTDYTELVPSTDNEGKTTYGYTNDFTLEADYAPVKWDLKVNGKSLVETIFASEDLSSEIRAKLEAYGLTEDGAALSSVEAIVKKIKANDTYKQIVDEALAELVEGGYNFDITETTIKVDGEDIAALSVSYDFEPGKEMNYEFTLTWKWAFEQADDADTDTDETALFDKADTYLGNVAAGVFEDANATTEISAVVIASATQID